MGLHLVILGSEGDRPFRIPLLVLGACLLLYGLLWAGQKAWWHFATRKGRQREFEEWTAIACARGFVVEPGGEEWAARTHARGFEMARAGKGPVMRGTIAGRPFEMDGYNFFGYGADAENALRFRVEDEDAKLSICRGSNGQWAGDLQPATGDEEFDKRCQVYANPAGLQWIARLGPKERRLLVDYPEFIVDQSGGEVRIRMPYRIDLAHLDAACRLAESVWGPPPTATSGA